MYNIIALAGKGGSGKDTLMQSLLKLEPSLNEIVSCTTRPPREGEQDGVNYHFYTPEVFAQKLMKDEMAEATVFNEWAYGTPYSSLDEEKINIGVFNPAGIETLTSRPDINLQVFYITAPDNIRLIRQLSRESNPYIPEVFRRYWTDEEDFEHFSEDFAVTEIKNDGSQTPMEVAKTIQLACEQIQGIFD